MELKGSVGMWTDHAKDTFFASGLSALTTCGAEPIAPEAGSEHWLDDYILNTTLRFAVEAPKRQIMFELIRKADWACREYESGRVELQAYFDEGRPTKLRRYSRALSHFEACLAGLWQGWSLARAVVPEERKLFVRRDDTAFERVHVLYTASKHADEFIASGRHAPDGTLQIWFTNVGLQGIEKAVSFRELKDLTESLCRVATYVSNPDAGPPSRNEESPSADDFGPTETAGGE